MELFSFIKKALLFPCRYLLKDPFFIVLYVTARVQKRYQSNARFFTESEFLDEIKKGKSIIRMGDGEISLLHGRSIHYQIYKKELALGLKKTIQEHSSECSYVMSIPVFVNYSNTELNKTPNKLSCWLPLKVEFRRVFNKEAGYADAHFFYYRDKMMSFFKSFVENKPVIFISNAEKNALIRNKINYPADFVDTPSEHSFESIDTICNQIDAIIEKDSTKKYVLVISTGPTSKILAHTYTKKGYQSFDVGFGLNYIYDTKDYSYLI